MEFFLIFSNCKLTRGANRSLISDLQEQQLFFIPNELYDIIVELKKTPLIQVKKKLDTNTRETLMEYIQYFINEGIGFYTSDPDRFPDLSLQYNTPETISNAVIDLDKNSSYNLKKVIDDLIHLQCKYLEVRSYSVINIEKINKIIQYCTNGYFKNIDFITQYSHEKEYSKQLRNLVLNSPLIGRITFHSSPKKQEDSFVRQTQKVILNNSCCGNVNQNNFISSLAVFSESQHHNTCLHKKISLDVNGSIKNCPSMRDNYGNIGDTSLKKALETKGFKKHWNITKDQIKVCKDCEFRYVCTDCRAYTEDPNDKYAKPLKCGYDPYTNQWTDWSTNSLKQKAIQYYKVK